MSDIATGVYQMGPVKCAPCEWAQEVIFGPVEGEILA